MKLINYYSNQSRFEFRIQLYLLKEYKYSLNAGRKILNKRVKIWKNASKIFKIFRKN